MIVPNGKEIPEGMSEDAIRLLLSEVVSLLATMRLAWGQGPGNATDADDIFAEMAAETVSVSSVDDSYESIYTQTDGE